MAVACWAPNCNHNNIRHKCRFYRFPKDVKILQKWLTLLRRQDRTPSIHSRVCSCHFKDGLKENGPTFYEPSKQAILPISEEKETESLVIDQSNTTATPQFTNQLSSLQFVCRTCLENCATYFDIFNHTRNNIFLADMLEGCTSLKIRKEDGYPVNICNDCMQKLISAFDFKMMVTESNTKLKLEYELCRWRAIKIEDELCNNIMEDVHINEEVFVKIEQTTITDLQCKNEDTLGDQGNIEEISVKVKLESSEENDSFLDDFAGTRLSLEDASKTEMYGEITQTPPVMFENQAAEETMDIKVQSEYELVDNNGGVPDLSSDYIEDVNKKSFLSKHLLQCDKVLMPTEERPYKCNTCELSFKTSSHLGQHTKIHLKDNTKPAINFDCTTCGKMFTHKRDLNYHSKIHLSENPYVCNYCGKRFLHKSGLSSHVLIHTGVKPFACEICGKTFNQRSTMRTHTRVHTGETPYSCSLCPSSFKFRSSLVSHMKVHEKNR